MTSPESYIGRYIDFDKAYGDQCVDLVNQYCADNGWPTFTGGAAADMFGQHPSTFDWVQNTPEGIAPAGAVVVWNRGIGPYGHIAIARAGSDTNTLRTVDQNWNGHPYAEAVNHNYNAVIGWGIPKTNNQNQGVKMNHDDGVELYRTGLFREPESPNVADQWNGLSPRDAMKRLEATEEWQSYSKKVHDYDNQVKKVADLTKQVADLQKQVSTSGGIDQATKDQISNTNSIVQKIWDKISSIFK